MAGYMVAVACVCLMNDMIVYCLQVFLRNRSVRDLAEASKLLLSPSVKMLLLEIVVQIVFTAIGIVFKISRDKASRVRAVEDEPSSSRI